MDKLTWRAGRLGGGLILLGCALPTGTIQAAQRGSVNEYPLGITMGMPTATLPPAGLYLIIKPTLSAGDSVDRSGIRTGTRISSWAANGQLQWVHAHRLLGARWASYIRSVGVVDVQIRLPDRQVLHGHGMPDVEVQPASLSWQLSQHVYLQAGAGFYAPTGKTSGDPSIGQDHWTLEHDFSIGYIDRDWTLVAHTVFNFNSTDTATRYRNGSTATIDYTAFRKSHGLAYGLVGYYHAQFSRDHGPQALNAGRPKAFSLGPGMTVRHQRFSFGLTLTRELFTRHLARKTMLLANISCRL